MFSTVFSHQNLALSNSEDSWSSDRRADSAIRALNLMIKILKPFVCGLPMRGTGDLYLNYRFDAVAFILRDMIPKGRAFEDLYTCYCVSSSLETPPTEAVSLINSLLDGLNDISLLEAEFVIHFKEQIEALQEKLLVLRYHIRSPSEICIQREFLVNLVTFAEALALNVACVLYFILLGKMKVEKSEKELSDVQKLVYVIRFYLEHVKAPRFRIIGPFVTGEYALGIFDSLINNLRNESKSRAYFEVVSEEQFEILLQGLSSVRCYIEKTPSHDYKEGLDNFRAEFLDLIVELGLFSCSNKGLESEKKVSNLLDKIQFIKSASGALLIPTSWQYDFPKTNELGFIDFILVNLRERLQSNMISADLWSCSIDTVYKELVSLRDDFGKMAEFRKENEEVRALFTHYRNVAYQAEYFFDLSLSAAEFSVYQRLGLTSLRESIRQIRCEVKAITTKMSNDNLVHNIANISAGISLEGNSTSIDVAMASKSEAGSNAVKATDQLVGLEDEIETLKQQLTGGSKQLNILSIVGMAGIGKTTLATSVYEDPEVILHFHARAWCSVSQVYGKENLLLEILRQIQSETKQVHGKNDKEFDQQVYQSLKGKRYLVILDDIWDVAVWNDLRLSFPDDSNGSRVMFTTRNHEVAFQANSVPHALQLLSDEESWKLLRVKVFKEETCPTELWQVGKNIAENCKGLPLAVDLIAGVLRATERRETCWGQVAKQLRTYINDYTSGQKLGTLELSYMHLPDYLKPCFLYFGVFPEDAEIPVNKLVCLWVAEGFIQPKVDHNSLEYEAENYLNALIHRSLVISTKRSSRGGVKTCRIHDLLRDFCLVRAKEEKFLRHINWYDKDNLPTFRISEMHEQYRLCVYSSSIPLIRLGYFESRVRTLLLSKFSYVSYREHLQFIAVVEKFKLLRVLELAGSVKIQDQEGFITISRLVYLRYLAIRACLREIPAEVANLKNLETFLVRGSVGAVSSETIWIMTNLRHLHIDIDTDRAFYSRFRFPIYNTKGFEGLWQLESLRTLSTPTLWCEETIDKMMRYIPNLLKLKCTFLDSWDHSKCCNQFPVLDFLNRLESLKVIFSGKGLHPCNLSFPLSIKKLTLMKSCLPWNDISLIGTLPNLEVLKLQEAFRGPEWNMKDGEFHTLKYLKLCSLDITRWNASSEHLPHLEELVLEDCGGLEEIPSVLGETPTLRSIHVKQCNHAMHHAAKQIKEEQHEMGNDQFNVFIFGTISITLH